jgi:hypothetical protein
MSSTIHISVEHNLMSGTVHIGVEHDSTSSTIHIGMNTTKLHASSKPRVPAQRNEKPLRQPLMALNMPNNGLGRVLRAIYTHFIQRSQVTLWCILSNSENIASHSHWLERRSTCRYETPSHSVEQKRSNTGRGWYSDQAGMIKTFFNGRIGLKLYYGAVFFRPLIW